MTPTSPNDSLPPDEGEGTDEDRTTGVAVLESDETDQRQTDPATGETGEEPSESNEQDPSPASDVPERIDLFGEAAELKRKMLGRDIEAREPRTDSITIRINSRERELIEKTVQHSQYDAASRYVRDILFGWTKNQGLVPRLIVLLRWAQAHAGEEIGPEEWADLERVLKEVYVYLEEHPGRRMEEQTDETDLEEVLETLVEAVWSGSTSRADREINLSSE
jgi:hypothetical protein